jgi:hypothetical protein
MFTVFKELHSLGGGSFLNSKYNGSPSQLLAEIYPDYNWLPWKFGKCPQKFWDDTKNQRKFMDWAAQELNIKEMTDWHKISYQVKIFIKILTFSGIMQNWRFFSSYEVQFLYVETIVPSLSQLQLEFEQVNDCFW